MNFNINSEVEDVIIVGAGPAGLSLATALERQNVGFRILERKPEPEPFTKACNFWPRTMEVFDSLGVLDRLLTESVEAHTQTIYAFGKFIRHNKLDSFPSPHPTPVLIGQNSIERILSTHLAEKGREVEYRREVLQVRETSNFIEVTVGRETDEPEILRARYLVGGDGGRSLVRESAGIHIEPEPMPNRALRLCDVQQLSWGRSTEKGQIWFFFHDTGYVGVLPFFDGTWRLWIFQDEKQVPNREPTLDEIQTAAREIIGDPTLTLNDALWLSHGRMKHGVAPKLQQGRVFLIGDAGHVTIPVGGQGMNTGIQDGFSLGWRLGATLRGEVNPIVLDSYSLERQPVKQNLHEEQVESFKQHVDPSAIDKLLFKWLGPTSLFGDRVSETNTNRVAQLDIKYSKSPLTVDYLRNSGARAGMRAPDARVVDVLHQKTVSLFELFYVYNGDWTLLLFDGARNNETAGELRAIANQVSRRFAKVQSYIIAVAPDSPRSSPENLKNTLLDLDRFAHTAFELDRPALILVRPDGYIGYRSGKNSFDKLVSYCEQVFSQVSSK